MLFSRMIEFATSQSRVTAAARLSAVVLPVVSAPSLKPVRVSDFIAQYRGKRFSGNFDGFRFKLVLITSRDKRFQVRGNVVVIVGGLDEHAIKACLRLPFFTLGFLAIYASCVLAGLILSFFGSSNLLIVQVPMALAIAIPAVLVFWLFRRKAAEAEQALRETVLGQ